MLLGMGAELPAPAATVLPSAAEPAGALPSGRAEFDDVVDRTETCARRAREHLAASSASRARDGRTPAVEESEFEQTLERRLAVLETLLQKFRSADAATDGIASLAADLDAAGDVCGVVEAMIEAWEWRG